jgi:hypothetical protein
MPRNCPAFLLAAIVLLTSGIAAAQPAAASNTSLTLAQIVQRQEENYGRIRNAEGQVVWMEEAAGQAPTSTSVRVIFFAFEGDRSVNLITAWDPTGTPPARDEKMDWTRVLAAFFVEGDRVHKISLRAGAKTPAIETTSFNPAVHENNPLVGFQPRMLGEERVRLRDLVELTPQMKTRPNVRQVSREGRALLQVEFTNEKAPGEGILYTIAPDKGYLAEELVRMSGGRVAARSTITIGQTRDGIWIPARRVKMEYDNAGRALTRETWYYLHLATNEGLARRALSFEFFRLPSGTRVPTMASPAATQPTAGQPAQTQATATPPPLLGRTPTPIPPPVRRVSPTPRMLR